MDHRFCLLTSRNEARHAMQGTGLVSPNAPAFTNMSVKGYYPDLLRHRYNVS